MKRYLILFTLLFLVVAGCKKDFLDSKPLDKYSDEDVWRDSTLAGLFLNNLYATLPTQFGGTMTDAYTDELYSSGNVSIYNGTFLASSVPYSISNTYNYSYSSIRRCNIYLENVDRLPASTAFKKKTADQARFIRAFQYANLINYFGAVPLITHAQNLDENLNVARNSYQEVVNFIVSEMDAINTSANLPYKYTGADVGRVTRGAALALKSRVLLYAASYNGEWQKAYDAAKAVVAVAGSAGYGLFPKYGEMFFSANDNNAEVIFDHQYKQNFQGYNVHFYNLPWGLVPPGPNALNQPTQNIVNEYEMANGKMITEAGSGYDETKPYANRDPRFDASVLYDGSVYTGVTLDFIPGSNFNPQYAALTTGYALRKMEDPAFNPFDMSASYGGGQNNILIRYAEILLNLAEASFELGQTEEARTYVNQVRARVGMPPVASGAISRDKIRHERTIELAFEGTRLWDIRRWKLGPDKLGTPMNGILITQTGTGSRVYTQVKVQDRTFDPKFYLFPIYQTEIDKNPNLKPNNPGW